MASRKKDLRTAYRDMIERLKMMNAQEADVAKVFVGVLKDLLTEHNLGNLTDKQLKEELGILRLNAKAVLATHELKIWQKVMEKLSSAFLPKASLKGFFAKPRTKKA